MKDLYTSKQVQIQKEFVVQGDEKQGVYGAENGETLHLLNNDTPGWVCIEMLNDTPGCVDKHKAGQMAVRSFEKAW